jgi:uncharacterized delta-60 repeat protein
MRRVSRSGPRAVRLAAVAALAGALAAPAAASATAPGALDSRFGRCGETAGLVPRDIGKRQFSYGAGSALATDSDGRILAAGPAARGMGVTRFTRDGKQDESFGDRGVAFVPLTSGGDRFVETRVNSLAVTGDGRIAVAGWVRAESGSGGDIVQRFVIARFTADGRPDTSFSGDGILSEVPPGATTALVLALVPGPGGGLLVAGEVDETFAVARYRDDGTLDPAFGAGGVARVTAPGHPGGEARALTVLPDGRIVAAGYTTDAPGDTLWTVAALTPAGAPDPGFGTGGVRTESFDDYSRASAIVMYGGDRFDVVGSAWDRWGEAYDGELTGRAAIVRYTPSGNRDDSFGSGGAVLDAWGGGLFARVEPTAAARDPEGRLVVASSGQLARYAPGGARDAAFGTGGVLRLFDQSLESLAAAPDGGLLVGGEDNSQSVPPAGFERGPAVMRLAGSGTALDAAQGQPAACVLRVRNPSLAHLLRRGKVAKGGKLRVGMVLTQPGSGRIDATATAGGRTFPLAGGRYRADYQGSTGVDLANLASAAKRLRGARSATIRLMLTPDDAGVAPVTASRTLAR